MTLHSDEEILNLIYEKLNGKYSKNEIKEILEAEFHCK